MQVRSRTVAEDPSISEIGNLMVFNDNNISNKHDEHSFIKEISESGIMGVAKDYVGSLIMDAGKSMIMPMITSLVA